MTAIYVGIDPGARGGLAAMSKQSVWAVCAMPMSGKEVDGFALRTWFEQETGYPNLNLHVLLEKVSAMPKQGVTAMFNFGKGYGIIQGVLQCLQISYQLVTPQAWKKLILAGTPRDKLAAIEYCHKIYPYVDLIATPRSRVPHDGIADALCIATYGVMKSKG